MENKLIIGGHRIGSKRKFDQRSLFETDRLYEEFRRSIPKKSRILDIGSGKGIVANFFLNDKISYEYYGIDISNILVESCVKDYGPYFMVGDATRLPIKDNSFDVIIFNVVLHHIPDIKSSLKDAARILRTNGIIFIQEPNKYSFQILVLGNRAPLRFIYGDLLDPNERPLNPVHIIRCLQYSRLEITSCVGTNIFPLRLLRILPLFIGRFMNKIDLIMTSILHFPLICTGNFRIIAKNKNR